MSRSKKQYIGNSYCVRKDPKYTNYYGVCTEHCIGPNGKLYINLALDDGVLCWFPEEDLMLLS